MLLRLARGPLIFFFGGKNVGCGMLPTCTLTERLVKNKIKGEGAIWLKQGARTRARLASLRALGGNGEARTQ
jgi:hypothetical protein